ncbi:MAG TPA: 50S ribosomal protein L17 [Candidatus Dependentiae bacterium]|nr:50S ribosomal protein L17 [Candidatus Dependentiae bacterium]HRQ62326.1 50S ribosomal protein L17 [Candidatus Dependentiae bacterium]
MLHQSGRRKLNLKSSHRRAMLRNQVINLIMYGKLVSTKARVKEAQRLAEKLVTIAREGNTYNARRRALSLLPYKEEALIKLFKEIAPRYTERPGGYTRVIPMGQRMSDTATIAQLEWV